MKLRWAKRPSPSASSRVTEQERTSWCEAPRAALYFAPDGQVFPCCAGRAPIGRFSQGGDTSLREVWRGEVVGRIRAAVDHGDLSLGCGNCATLAESDGRQSSLAVQFDRYAGRADTWPLDLEFALSNTCNLQCVMCNGELSSAIRSQREHRPPLPDAYDDRFFEELADFLPHAERIAFKGGEPFLAKEARRVMDLLLEQGSSAEVKVTTNATIWNDRVEAYARGLAISPIVSVDALDTELLERLRIGVDAAAVWRNVDRFQEVADESGAGLTFSYCLMRSNWQELAPLLSEAERRGAWVHVSLVTQPAHESLLAMGRPQLKDVLARMTTQGETLHLTDPSRQAAWDQALAWVRHCGRRPTSADATSVSVPLPARPRNGPPVGRPDGALVEELRAWADGDLLVLDAPLGVVADITAVPGWAEAWSPRSWVGRPTTDLPGALSAELGIDLVPDLQVSDGRRMVVVLRDPEGRARARVLVIKPLVDEVIYLALAADPAA